MWSQESFAFSGRPGSGTGARIEPKPQRRIPIWLGTYGNRALAVTGRLADGWIPSLGFAAPEQIPAMRDRVLADTVTGPADAVAEQLLGFLDLGFTAAPRHPRPSRVPARRTVPRGGCVGSGHTGWSRRRRGRPG